METGCDTAGAGRHSQCGQRTHQWVRETAYQDHSACKCIERDMYRHSLESAGVCGECDPWTGGWRGSLRESTVG